MSFEEWALVIYSVFCTITLIKTELELNNLIEYFEAYRKMSEIIEDRLKN